MGNASPQSRCLDDPDGAFERWNGIRGINFNASCDLNLFILNSLYTGLVIWLSSTATVNLDDVIKSRVGHNWRRTGRCNRDAQRAALWACSFGVAFGAAFAMSLLLKLFFGYDAQLRPPAAGAAGAAAAGPCQCCHCRAEREGVAKSLGSAARRSRGPATM